MASYKELAEADFKAAKGLIDFEMMNHAGQLLQQACEKQMKSYLESKHKLDISLEKTHNLRKLLREIGGYENDFYKTAALIENYFFDTRYPGEDYIDLSEQDIENGINFYNDLVKFLESKS